MVDRVGSTPQLGGRNLNELVARRDSQKTLVRSVSGPPATAVAPSNSKAPKTEPAIKAPDTEEQINKARERRRRLESSTLSVQRAAQGENTSSQLRELTGQALQDLSRRSSTPEPIQPEQAQGKAGVAFARSAPDSGQDNTQASAVESDALGGGGAPEVAPIGVGGNAGQQAGAVGAGSRSQPATAVSEPKAVPTLQTSESRDPQALIDTSPSPQVAGQEVVLPSAPETSANNRSSDSADSPEVKGDVVDIVA